MFHIAETKGVALVSRDPAPASRVVLHPARVRSNSVWGVCPTRSPVAAKQGHLSLQASEGSRHRVTCSASPSSAVSVSIFDNPASTSSPSSSLASYPFQTSSGSSRAQAASSTWLVHAVRHICTSVACHNQPQLHVIKHRDQYSSTPDFTMVPISAEVANNPQNWSSISEYARGPSVHGIVLVRPLPQDALPKPCAASPASAASGTSAASCSTSSSCGASCSSSASASFGSMDELQGSLDDGDCCRGHDSAGGASDHHHHHHHSSSHAPTTTMYGLVVQGRVPSNADGCYVLKTSNSLDSVGCSCTHFSLTHICPGQPLATQLRDAWLV